MLEATYGVRWWTRDRIGQVVCAGGFHAVIQLTTIRLLKQAGLVQTERSSWPIQIAAAVKCSCGTWNWGLTDPGRAVAARVRMNWTADSLAAVKSLAYQRALAVRRLLDEDDATARTAQAAGGLRR